MNFIVFSNNQNPKTFFYSNLPNLIVKKSIKQNLSFEMFDCKISEKMDWFIGHSSSLKIEPNELTKFCMGAIREIILIDCKVSGVKNEFVWTFAFRLIQRVSLVF